MDSLGPSVGNPLMLGLLHVRIAKAPMDTPMGPSDMKQSRHQATTGPRGAHGRPGEPRGALGSPGEPPKGKVVHN